MISVSSNVYSLRNLRDLYSINLNLSDSIEKLSSGKRINSGADDPSGLAISAGMTAKYRGLDVATQNVQDGLKWLEARDRAMGEQYDISMRMRDLALRASNEATLTTADQAKLNDEAQELLEELTRIGRANTLNSKNTLYNPGQLDVIWVLDQTGSMGPYLNALGNAAEGMYKALAGAGFDLRMAAVGFEDDISGSGTRAFTSDFNVFGDDVVVQIGGALFGSEEDGLESIDSALDLGSLGGDFREDAQKVVILITDEDSDDGLSTDYYYDLVFPFNPNLVNPPNGNLDPLNAAAQTSLVNKLSNMDVTLFAAGDMRYYQPTDPPGAPAMDLAGAIDQDYATVAVASGGQALYLDDPGPGLTPAWVTSITDSLSNLGGPWDDRFYVGGESDQDLYRLEYNFETITAEAQKLSVDLTTTAGAQSAVDSLDGFIDKMGDIRAYTANVENQFQHIVDELQNEYINIRAANSKIEDTNMAVEISRFTKNQIMQMGSLAASAFANNMPATVLDLISQQGLGSGGAF